MASTGTVPFTAPWLERLRKRSCTRKVRHDTRADAVGHVASLRKRGKEWPGRRLNVYHCRFCDGWHVGPLPRMLVYTEPVEIRLLSAPGGMEACRDCQRAFSAGELESGLCMECWDRRIDAQHNPYRVPKLQPIQRREYDRMAELLPCPVCGKAQFFAWWELRLNLHRYCSRSCAGKASMMKPRPYLQFKLPDWYLQSAERAKEPQP